MMKHLKRFVAITISMVMAFQFCTNDFYLYAETEPADPGQTQVTNETESGPSDSTGEAAEETPPSDIGTPEPSAPVEEQPAAPVEEQPAPPVEEQPEVASTLKVEFVDVNNASVKETVEQALTSKYVGKTINLDELGIDINVEGYTLTEVKDKNDNTKVYTTETKDFVLTGNVTELQFVYTQNVQTDQPEDSQEPSTPQGGQEDQEDTDESSKDEAISKVVLLKNLLVEDRIDVVIDGVESVEKMHINAGSIPNESCEIPGYVFQYAKTSNGNSLNYVGMNNGEIYYSLLNDESDYYQPATKLGKDESIVLVYAKIGYQINLSINNGGNAENTVDCPGETLDGQGFTLKTTTARGYKAEVKVNDSVIEGEDGVYTIDADTAKPVEGSNAISVEVIFTKQETYSYWVANPNVANWHSASWDGIGNKDNKLTFDSGNTFDFRFSTTDGVVGSDRIIGGEGSETIFRLNSFQINGYDVQVPSTYNVGATESTTLPSGTIVTITCVTAPEYHDYGWDFLRNHWNPANYTYEVTISNAMEDIVVTGGNFRAKDWAEVMVLDITGVQLEIYDGREWQEAKRSTPYAYNNSTQKSFRYKVLPGYGNAVVNIANNSGTIVNESFEDGYYYFTIDRGNNIASYLSVQATPINYSVKYDGGENSSNIPEDDLKYSISNAEGTTDTIYISNQIPTMEGKVFNG